MEHRGTKALEVWARRATDGYQGVSITNMSTAWRNGLAFCALIHRFRPDLIDFASLKPENILENNALAFRVAEQHLGIPALLDAEDMVENDVPDRLSVLTYVSQFYQAFHSMGLTSPKRIVNTTASTQSALPGVNKSKPLPTPQPKTKTEIKTDKVLTGGRGRREVCVGCNNPVYLAERLLVGSPGQLMHRTCFRCARCSTQLTLASYYETEKSQFCCETCPDEERPVIPDVDSTSIASSASTKLARQSSASDSESDSDSEDSDEESDSYSNDADSMLEDVSRISSTQNEISSRLPKPRTVFLTKTLEHEDSKDKPEEPKEDNTHLSRASNFSQVSPALFGSKVKDSGVEGKRDSRPDHCDNAKVLKTDPPERLTLDTGQGDRVSSISNGKGKGSSSIVAERLKLFREIGDKTTNADRAKSSIVLSSKVISEKKENVQIKEKESVPKQEETLDIDEKDQDEDTKDMSNGKDVQVDKFISDYLQKDETEDMEVDSKTYSEKTKENDTPSIVIPSITMSVESTDEKLLQEDDAKQDEARQPAAEERSPKLSHSTNAQAKEFNPFEDEDESQQDESGVVVNQSHSSPAMDKNDATLASHDSGADVSSASAQSVQYPNDLNPFGSDEEEEEEKESEPAEVEESEKQTKKLIKANLNPFGSDEDDVSEDESKAVEEKEKSLKNLNPFWSDDEEDEDEKDKVNSSSSTPTKNKVKPPRPPPPTLARNSTPSQMYGTLSAKSSPSSVGGTTPSKKIIAPPPPSARELFPQEQDVPLHGPPKPPRSPALSKVHPHPSPSPSSPGGSVALKRKDRRAPAPPQAATPRSGRTSPTDTINSDSLSVSSFGAQSQTVQGQEDQDEVLSWKMQKDLKNHSNKMNGTADQLAPPKPARAPQIVKNLGGVGGLARNPSMSKSEAGEWQRKKGPAPPRPVPQKRALKKMPMRLVQQELQDIEIKQTELERQGVLLETAIRKRTESTSNNPQDEVANAPNSGPNSIEVEDMILQLFELVNEKNELFRRQTELMYLKREKRLEEEYVELEYQIRCLMLKTPGEKTAEDTAQEEDLIARLVKVVEQRDEIINCLELDRLREAQEDESIATHMMQYQEKHIDGNENGNSVVEPPKKKKTLKLPKKKKKKKEKKDKKGAKGDADKDIDETEAKEQKKKKKKKWLF